MISIEIINITAVIFGISALVLASKARNRLTPGSLRMYIDNFSVCLAFVVIFSIWQTLRIFTGASFKINGLSDYPEYIFLIFTYLAFVVTSYRIVKISKEFGFKEEGKKIEKILKNKK